MAEPWWICFFVYLFTDHCMQSWNAAFVVVGYLLWGEKKISGSGSKLNCAGRVGRSPVWARFGLQFKARADLYNEVGLY